MPPATKPATAPVRARSVGAIRRTAQTTAANGTTAMMGMETRHSSQPSPIAMLCQCQSGAETRLTVASEATADWGTKVPVLTLLERRRPDEPAAINTRFPLR